MIYDDTGSVEGSTGWYLVVLGQYGAVLVDRLWYMVSRRQYWIVVGGVGSDTVWSGTDWDLVVLGQYNLVLLGIKKNGLVKGFYDCILKEWRFGRMLP